LLPYALLMLPPTDWRLPELVLSAALTLLVGAGAVLVPWARMPSWTHVLPPLAYIGALALLRNAGAGTSSGVGVLALLPVFWLALYGTRAQLAIVLVAVLAFFIVPVMLVGAPYYPPSGVRVGILFNAVAAIVGITVQGLVGRTREQAREREKLSAHLAELAYTDALTGLPNRRAWTTELEREMARAGRTGEPLTVAMVDIDDFKVFNDTHGHDRGDQLLASSAASWRANLRAADTVARIGGDEFAILLPGAGAGEARQVLERMLPLAPDGPTFSIGFAEWDRKRSASAFLHAADLALYEAKRRQRSAVVGA
jgi:diguanylate cyclase (GGDEF)-like protein